MTDSTTQDQTSDARLRSVHTSNLPGIFGQLGISLAVTTYQAGKLVLVRNDGGVINTHFRVFNKPMGLAVSPQRCAQTFRNETFFMSV